MSDSHAGWGPGPIPGNGGSAIPPTRLASGGTVAQKRGSAAPPAWRARGALGQTAARAGLYAQPAFLPTRQPRRQPGESIPVPWGDEQSAAWRGALGRSVEAERALSLGAATLSQNTLRTYSGPWRKFVAFCAARNPPLCPLPASAETVMLYIAWHSQRKRADGSPAIQASSFRPYRACIDTAQREVFGANAPQPASDPRVKALMKGWLREQYAQEGAQRDVRAPLPAVVALRALQELAGPLPATRAEAEAERALTSVVVAFATLMRPSSYVPLAHSEVRRHAAGTDIRPTKIKNGELKPRLPLPKLFPADVAPWMSDIVDRWLAVQAAQWASSQRGPPPSPSAPMRFWLLPGERSQHTEYHAVDWFSTAMALLDAHAPMGLKYEPYSCRKGGASAATAQGMDLGALCSLGDWAPGSSVPEKHYIDRSVQRDVASRFFFGFRTGAARSST